MTQDYLDDQEIEALVRSIRRRAMSDNSPNSPTDKQVKALVVGLGKILRDPRNRKKVLAAITGLNLKSQKELTFWYHSVLIDETRQEKNYNVFRRIETVVEDQFVQNTFRLFPWDVPAYADMSLLPETDT
ncbi:MAG: hypothetical protein V1775_02255 [Bacteroidota bacterium]